MIWLVLLIFPAVWLLMNWQYGRSHGTRLRWPYIWAAHGALLYGRRLPKWERGDDR